ncbi:HK97-gp10 family putative phage morphogenesis protein [Carnobacterium maltaromaticum]|uniref:HK97-gp10 family putative phage morphogenesis protein n=1 Tax=Carnobacterium maltaromaticum TaxID=2751 RepID=UPI0039B00A8A
MSMRLRFEGMNSFVSGMEQLTREIIKEIEGATQETGLRIERSAARKAPFDTGFLSQSIAYLRKAPLVAEVTAFADYAWYVENGTRRMYAQPFLFPAVKEESERYFRVLRNIVNNGVI